MADAPLTSENRLSIAELEDRIAALQGELQSRLKREPEIHWYTCRRCGSFYTSLWGCGCPLIGSIDELERRRYLREHTPRVL